MDYWKDNNLRSFTCWQCKHCAETGDLLGNATQHPKKNLCALTNRWGSLQRGRYCEHFEYYLIEETEEDVKR